MVISTKDMSVGVENGIRDGGSRGSKDLETARQGSGTGAPSGYLPSSELSEPWFAPLQNEDGKALPHRGIKVKCNNILIKLKPPAPTIIISIFV